MGQLKLMPFGKYQGRPVEQLQQTDPGYLQWLSAQPWFREKHATIHTLIVNNFKEDCDTPEHNRLQARFLDKQYAYNVACSFRGKDYATYLSTQFCEFVSLNGVACQESSSYRKSYRIGFEVSGWDVCLEVNSPFFRSKPILVKQFDGQTIEETDSTGWGLAIKIELKPCIGDDFPTVLRQVKARPARSNKYDDTPWLRCVFAEEFNSSVDIASVKEMFRLAGIRLLVSQDIKSFELPNWIREANVEGIE
jgi:hypothetical protein